LEIRGGSVSFDPKLDALAKLVKSITKTHGKPDTTLLNAFFATGYTEGNLVDVIMVIGDKIISNYLHGVSQVPIDFPEAPVLESIAS
jgi:hypothetical protein